MDKTFLRQAILKKRDSLSRPEMQNKSRRAAGHLQQLEEFRRAVTLLVYLSFKKEVDTIPIIKTAWRLGKIVAVPVCRPGKKLLLSQLNSLNELGEGAFGIQEPLFGYIRPVAAGQIDLAILPGVAFDLKGNRLGFGGGYFDRFLPLLRPDCPRLALAYDFQIVETLPAEEHAIKMDNIVTESMVIYVK